MIFVLIIFAEWFTYLRGFNTSVWTLGNWLMLAFIVMAEAVAVGIITRTVDRALPAVGNRVLAKDVKQSRRSSPRSTPR